MHSCMYIHAHMHSCKHEWKRSGTQTKALGIQDHSRNSLYHFGEATPTCNHNILSKAAVSVSFGILGEAFQHPRSRSIPVQLLQARIKLGRVCKRPGQLHASSPTAPIALAAPPIGSVLSYPDHHTPPPSQKNKKTHASIMVVVALRLRVMFKFAGGSEFESRLPVHGRPKQ